jgi:hypothetical protein
MTRSKRFSGNSARNALRFVFFLICAAGCSTSTIPTYSKYDLDKAIEKILKAEYTIDGHAELAGKTLWLYLPIDNLFEKTSGKDPDDKIKERFDVQVNESSLRNDLLSVSYLVRPIVPEREKDQGYKLNKKAMEKINNAWDVMRRVVFSMDRKERDDVQFYVLMAADTTNGLELRETIYYQDLIKVLYRVISPGEYRHRVPVKSGLAPEVIGNKEGKNIKYTDMSFSEFLCAQIEHRIGLKFQKPEVEQNADMDKEIQKIVLETLRIYTFLDFRVVELTNLLTNVRGHIDPGDVRNLKPIR